MTICNPFASTKLINDMCIMLYVCNIVVSIFKCLYYNKNFGNEGTLLTGAQHTFSDSTCYWIRLWDEINHKIIGTCFSLYMHVHALQ